MRPSVVRLTSASGTGTGFIYRTAKNGTEAYIVTAAHVVQGQSTVRVTNRDSTVVDGVVLGSDEDADIAVIRACCDRFKAGLFGEAGRLDVGESLMGLGYALNLEGAATLTEGVLSWTGETGGVHQLQTDVPLNPGNSGGPLFTDRGRVVAIVTWQYTDASGISFATSQVTLARLLPRLEKERPRPTPTPAPTIAPTGNWSEVEKLKITGTSRNTWVTTLYGWGPLSPDEAYRLVFRCSDVKGGGRLTDLFFSIHFKEGETRSLTTQDVIVLYGYGATQGEAASYAVRPSDPQDPRVIWQRTSGSDGRYHSFWAPLPAKDEIVAGILGGSSILVLKDVIGEWSRTFIFDVTGFAAASEEIRERCR